MRGKYIVIGKKYVTTIIKTGTKQGTKTQDVEIKPSTCHSKTALMHDTLI